jgi:CubicO group peptidase (beta-lactamase class C family)
LIFGLLRAISVHGRSVASKEEAEMGAVELGPFVRGEPAELSLDPARVEQARAMIREQIESGRSPGIVAFVARRGRVFLHEAMGVRNPAGDAMRHDTLFSIASATKPMTAAVVISLVEDGKIGLLQCVRDYLPELPASVGDGVLVHHLLTHTAGFDSPMWTGKLRRRLLEKGDEDARWGRDPVVNAFLGCMEDVERIKPPGAGMLYASFGYELLGEIVRRVCGTATVDEVLAARLFEPLGMKDSAMTLDAARRARFAEPLPDGPQARMAESYGLGLDVWLRADAAAGGLLMTALDHAIFEQMILGGGELAGVRVLSKASVRAMTTNQIPGVPDVIFGRKEASWGYGFSVICQERWPYFGGGLVPPGSVTHAGSGGISHWIDFENEIVGVYYEILTEMSERLEPVSSASHRFQDVITAAVLD